MQTLANHSPFLMVKKMEEDIVNIYADSNKLYCHIPASDQTFTLEFGEELDELPPEAVFVTQVNFTQIKEELKIKKELEGEK